jgi:hypothetical protein
MELLVRPRWLERKRLRLMFSHVRYAPRFFEWL